MAKESEKPGSAEMIEKLVPDTSAIIEGIVSKKIESKELAVNEVLIHEAVLSELEHQANLNKTTGFLGLDELQKLQKLEKEGKIKVTFSGKKPHASEIRHAGIGEIDSLIRDLAYDEGATLLTADRVQARVAKAKGISLIFIEFEKKERKLKLEEFFDNTTMSVHLRENVAPIAKKGFPGKWDFVKIRNTPMEMEEIKRMAGEIVEEAGTRRDSFLEIERPGSTIVQLGNFRIVITRPPFSDGWEITAVRPVKKLSLADYKISEKLMSRVSEQAEGILIAGAPGMGKSTFAQALAEDYASKGKIVKTVEAPRDLILGDEITQYSVSHGTPQEIHDVLLLSRPDNTIFDEMRNTEDFRLFADLRLSGIGLAGVIHATNPVDAIQRFVGRIELGVIPHVIDTVLFIKNGTVSKVLSLSMVVKVPSGMTEADLARPVVVVNDFETGNLEYELYSYGEETILVPVTAAKSKSPAQHLAEKSIEEEFKKYSPEAKVEMTSEGSCRVYVPDDRIARIIGKDGVNIQYIQEKLGLHIDVEPLETFKAAKETSGGESKESIEFNVQLKKKAIILFLDQHYQNMDIDIHIKGDYLMTAKAGKKSMIKIKKDNRIGHMLAESLQSGEKVELFAASNSHA